MAIILILGVPLLVLYVIAHRGGAAAFGDHRTEQVKELGLTEMQAHILGVPYKKRRR